MSRLFSAKGRALALMLAAVLAAACSDDTSEDDRRLDAGATPEEIADVLACTSRTEHVTDPGEPAQPAGSLDCLLGESTIGIQTYRDSGDVDLVLDYLDRFTGFRVVDARWIVAVDTEEAAETVAKLTGGRVIRLQGNGLEQAPSDPPYNDLEARIVDAMADLGISVDRAESSVNGAAMWATFPGGQEIYVTAQPAGAPLGESSVIDEQDIGGTSVRQVDYPAAGRRSQFDCGDAVFEVYGDTPPGFASMDAFLADLIDGLDCV